MFLFQDLRVLFAKVPGKQIIDYYETAVLHCESKVDDVNENDDANENDNEEPDLSDTQCNKIVDLIVDWYLKLVHR